MKRAALESETHVSYSIFRPLRKRLPNPEARIVLDSSEEKKISGETAQKRECFR
jgi:hypothetical protein